MQAGVRNIVIRTHCHQHRLTFREWITRLPWSRSDSIFARWLAGKIVFEQWWLFWAVARKFPPQCWQTTFVLTSLVSIWSCLPQTGQYWWKDFAVILPLVVIWNRCKNGRAFYCSDAFSKVCIDFYLPAKHPLLKKPQRNFLDNTNPKDFKKTVFAARNMLQTWQKIARAVTGFFPDSPNIRTTISHTASS